MSTVEHFLMPIPPINNSSPSHMVEVLTHSIRHTEQQILDLLDRQRLLYAELQRYKELSRYDGSLPNPRDKVVPIHTLDH